MYENGKGKLISHLGSQQNHVYLDKLAFLVRVSEAWVDAAHQLGLGFVCAPLLSASRFLRASGSLPFFLGSLFVGPH
jgi:hypothetical protein